MVNCLRGRGTPLNRYTSDFISLNPKSERTQCRSSSIRTLVPYTQRSKIVPHVRMLTSHRISEFREWQGPKKMVKREAGKREQFCVSERRLDFE